MPQMMPLSWFILFMFFSTMFMMFNFINYYSYLPNSSCNTKNFFMNKMNWKW